MRQRQLGIRNQWKKESPGAWKGNSVRTAPLKQHWPKRLLIMHLPAEVPEFCCLLSFPVFKVENILLFWLTKKKKSCGKDSFRNIDLGNMNGSWGLASNAFLFCRLSGACSLPPGWVALSQNYFSMKHDTTSIQTRIQHLHQNSVMWKSDKVIPWGSERNWILLLLSFL